METTGTFTSKEYNGVSAVIVYQGSQLIISTKPGWVRMCFGMVGEALVSAKERLRINISDVKHVKISEGWRGSQEFELETDNDTYSITFKKGDTVAEALKREISQRAKDKVIGG